VPEIINAEKIERLELLREIIHDLITDIEDPDLNAVMQTQTKLVGIACIGQFRRRSDPDQIETISIRHGEPFFLRDDGQIVLSPAKEGDFPDVLDFNIHPGN